ncbi:hypothetical protein [Xanthomonas citri]|uniref:hypothetical protein n=1 Tax=Xanthomonas citri TaxID=346 RepID=UPI0013F15516|nr:hypothetical protein [Xanthomonas citri]
MSIGEKAAWCNAQADEIERDLPLQDDPHFWDSPRMTADFLRRFAERLSFAGACS